MLSNYIIAICAILFFLNCFVVSGQVEQGLIIPGIIHFHLASSLILIVVLYSYFNKFKTKKNTACIDVVDIFVLVHLFYSIIQVISHPIIPIFSYHLINKFFLLGLFLIIRNIRFRENQPKILFVVLMAVGIGQATYGILQWNNILPSMDWRFPITGTFFNPAPFAGFLVSILPIAVYYSFFHAETSSRATFIRLTAFITTILIVFILPLTESRASWVAGITGLSIVLFRNLKINVIVRRYLKSSIHRISALIIGVCFIVIFGTGIILMRPESVYGRLLIWKITLQIVADNLIFGVGYNQYQPIFGQYQAAYFELNPDDPLAFFAGKGEFVFNEFLKILTEQGMIGFIVFMIMITLTLIRVFQRHDNRTHAIAASFCSILIFSIFSYPFSVISIKANFFLFLALLLNLNNQRSIIFTVQPYYKYLVYCATFALTIMLLRVFYYDYLLYQGSLRWNFATEKKMFFEYSEANLIYKNIYPVLHYEGAFLLEYGQSLYYDKKYEEATYLLERAKFITSDVSLYTLLGSAYMNLGQYEKAEENFKFAFNLNPYRLYPLYLLAKLYKEKEEFDKMISIAKKAISMELKVPSKTTDYIRSELSLMIKNTPREKNNQINADNCER